MVLGEKGGRAARRSGVARTGLLVISAHHFEESEFDGFRQIFTLLGEPVLLIVERDVAIKVGTLRPVLIEVEHVRIVEADMKVVVHAALFGAGLVDEAREQLEELGYLATYATHLKLAGKLDVKPGTTFKAGKAGEYTVGDGGEIVYGKPLMFTKDNIDQFNF